MISVGIPVFHPEKKYLEEAVRPVVEQLAGVSGAEIFIYDDSGVPTSVPEWLADWGLTGHVSYFRGEKNLGLAGAWNWCVQKGTRPLVHILHQDDVLLPGFYASVFASFEKFSEAGAVYNRTLFIDADGTWRTFSILASREDGLIENFNRKVFDLDIQCPSMVVRRKVYETVGLFDERFVYQLDREFWTRLSAEFEVCYVRQPRSCFRIHDGQQSAVLKKSKMTFTDQVSALPVLLQHYKGKDKPALERNLRLRLFQNAVAVLKTAPDFVQAWDIAFRYSIPRTIWQSIWQPGLRGHWPAAFFTWLTRSAANK